MPFKDVLKQQMEKKGIDTQAIADSAGVSKTYIYDLLKGSRRFNEEIEGKICAFLGIEKVYVEKTA